MGISGTDSRILCHTWYMTAKDISLISAVWIQIKAVFTAGVWNKKQFFLPPVFSQEISVAIHYNKEKLNISIGLISAWLFCKDARGEAGEYSILPLFLSRLSGDARHHHNFCFKGYSIFSFPLTEPVEKDSDKLLKWRDRHRDSTGKKKKKYYNAWSFVLQEYGEGKKSRNDSLPPTQLAQLFLLSSWFSF